jgi:outer membrane receptor protein involved in Fe transport
MSTLKIIAAAALVAGLAAPAFAQQQRRAAQPERAAPVVTGSVYAGPFNDRTQYLSQHTRNASQAQDFHTLNAAGAFGRR